MDNVEPGTPAYRSTRVSFWTTLVLTAIAVYLLSRVILPFASALFVAAVLAGAVHPLYERLAARMGGRRTVAAANVSDAAPTPVTWSRCWRRASRSESTHQSGPSATP